MPETAWIIARLERRSGFSLPAAVRDWYLAPEACRRLEQHSNDGHAIPLDALLPARGTSAWRALKRTGVCPFFVESQGMCTWGFGLEGDDPAVSISHEDQVWLPYIPSFTRMVRCMVFDWSPPFSVWCQSQPVTGFIEELERRYTLESVTHNFPEPGMKAWRFHAERSRFLCQDYGEWHLSADDDDAMRALLRGLWSFFAATTVWYPSTPAEQLLLHELGATHVNDP